MKPWFDHFDLLAPIYESVIRPVRSEEFWSLVDVPSEGIVLDAGGGTGRVSQYLIGKVKQIVVSDTSVKMLRESKAKRGLVSICGASEKLPFPDGLFDRIIMVDALHHVEDQQETASELWRALKPGGRLVIEEPDIHHFGVKMIALMEKLAFMRSHFLPHQHIEKLFSDYCDSIKVTHQNANIRILIQKHNY